MQFSSAPLIVTGNPVFEPHVRQHRTRYQHRRCRLFGTDGALGYTIVLEYSEALDDTVQVSPRSFRVESPPFRGIVLEVQDVSICGDRVTLSLVRPVASGFDAAVAYSPASEEQIRDLAGNAAGSQVAHGAGPGELDRVRRRSFDLRGTDTGACSAAIRSNRAGGDAGRGRRASAGLTARFATTTWTVAGRRRPGHAPQAKTSNTGWSKRSVRDQNRETPCQGYGGEPYSLHPTIATEVKRPGKTVDRLPLLAALPAALNHSPTDTDGMHRHSAGTTWKGTMTRIATGVTLLMLLFAAGCGDDENGGLLSPTAPTGVMSSAPMDTTAGQQDGDLTGLTGSARAAKADKRTIDFSGVDWSWNAARTHLEPDSFPDPRVNAGSNVWRRDSGNGLIRIFSDADLDGMSFSTAGSSWPLSQRRAGLFVSNINAEEVEQIRVGGESGGRGGGARATQLTCWPEVASSGVNSHLSSTAGDATKISVTVVVACDSTIPTFGNNPVTITDDGKNPVFNAARPSSTASWITPDDNWDKFQYRHPGNHFKALVVVEIPIAQNPSLTTAREGPLTWNDTSGTTESVALDIIIVIQAPLPISSAASLVLTGSGGKVAALQRVPLSLEVSGLDPTLDVECGIEEFRSDCTWRIRREVVDDNGKVHHNGGRLLPGGKVGGFIWEAPALSAGSTQSTHVHVQIETSPAGAFDRSESSNSVDFTVEGDSEPRSIHVRLGCEQNRPSSSSGYSECLWDTNNPPRDHKIIIRGNISTDPPCSDTDACWGTPEWRFSQAGAVRSIQTPSAGEFTDPTNGTMIDTHAELEWRIGSLRVGDHDQVYLGTDSPIGGVNGNGGSGTVVNIQVRDTNTPPEIGRQDSAGRRIDGITCFLLPPTGNQNQVDSDSCTALRDYPDGATALELKLGVTDLDSDLPIIAWSGSGVFRVANVTGGAGGYAGLATVTWDSAGLSPGQYTLTATVTENRGANRPSSNFRATRTVRVRVEDYTAGPTVEMRPTYRCSPTAGWENGTPNPMLGDPYCGQLHSRSHTWTGFTEHDDYVWTTYAHGGAAEIELEETTARSGMRIRTNENRICAVARGVCGPESRLGDESVHNDGTNIYQWKTVWPFCAGPKLDEYGEEIVDQNGRRILIPYNQGSCSK